MTASLPLLFDPGDEAIVGFDWSEQLTDEIGLVSVTHSVVSPLTKVSEATNTETGISQVKVSGAEHGGLYMVVAEATLSNGEVINRQFPIRGWNS